MNKTIQKLQNIILYFSPQNREKRITCEYEYWVTHYRLLTTDELNALYITHKARYEYKKHFFSVILITVGLAIVFGMTERLQKLLLIILESITINNKEVLFLYLLGIGSIGVLMIFIGLTSYLRSVYVAYQRTMILETMLSERRKHNK